MNKNTLDTLQAIYNAMLEINTRGADTVLMAQCLQALNGVIQKGEIECIEGQDCPSKEE